MKKNIGNTLALYPTPLVVVGAMVNGKPNWLLVGHLGIMGHDHVMVSLAKAHYTNQASGKAKSCPSILWTMHCLPRQIVPDASAAARKINRSCLILYLLTKGCR